jgi:CheY-like chemotaxis protein
VTLDINMPEMDGLTALSLIMAQRPTPVVMVSSLTEQGALATFEALALGRGGLHRQARRHHLAEHGPGRPCCSTRCVALGCAAGHTVGTCAPRAAQAGGTPA